MITIREVDPPSSTGESTNRYKLALSTLSTLLRQHHQNQDLQELLRTFVLSVAGQFRIPSVFMSLADAPTELPSQLTFFAVGQFRKCQQSVDLHKEAIIRKLGKDVDVLSDDDWLDDDTDQPVQEMLEKIGVHLIIPFRHDSKIVGLLGLGSRPPDGRYSAEEIEVLTTYAAIVAPFIGDLFLLFTLADVNRRHTNILNATKQAVLVFDRSGCLITLNTAASRMLLGEQSETSSSSSLIGMSQRLIFPPQAFPHWHKLIAEVSASNRPQMDHIIRSEASGRVYKISVTLLDDKDPTHSDLVVVMDDITEFKERENQFLSLQIAAEKGYMTASVAHEIGNFVSVILGGGVLSLQMIKNGRTDQAIKNLELLIDKAERLERYSNGLVNSHRLEPAWSYENINDLILSVTFFIEVQRRFAGISLELDLDSTMPKTRIDSDQLSQVFLNFLNNAADAISGAGRKDGVIAISSKQENDMIMIRLTDNGMGIKKDVQEKLFKEQFTTKAHGHGFGTILCEKIISNHEGKILVDSTEGMGTTFTICLPVKQLHS